MNKKQLIEKRDPDGMQRRFKRGPMHIFNPVPKNEKEATAHGNALAASGNYPLGTDECFNVGISGGCGPDCFVYQKGECTEPEEIKEMEKWRNNNDQKEN
jgi:hypothetical protein